MIDKIHSCDVTVQLIIYIMLLTTHQICWAFPVGIISGFLGIIKIEYWNNVAEQSSFWELSSISSQHYKHSQFQNNILKSKNYIHSSMLQDQSLHYSNHKCKIVSSVAILFFDSLLATILMMAAHALSRSIPWLASWSFFNQYIIPLDLDWKHAHYLFACHGNGWGSSILFSLAGGRTSILLKSSTLCNFLNSSL